MEFFLFWLFTIYVNYFIFIFSALNNFNVQRRDVKSGIENLKTELKNEIGNENLDALDNLSDELLFELQKESASQKKRST